MNVRNQNGSTVLKVIDDNEFEYIGRNGLREVFLHKKTGRRYIAPFGWGGDVRLTSKKELSEMDRD